MKPRPSIVLSDRPRMAARHGLSRALETQVGRIDIDLAAARNRPQATNGRGFSMRVVLRFSVRTLLSVSDWHDPAMTSKLTRKGEGRLHHRRHAPFTDYRALEPASVRLR